MPSRQHQGSAGKDGQQAEGLPHCAHFKNCILLPASTGATLEPAALVHTFLACVVVHPLRMLHPLITPPQQFGSCQWS